MDWFVFSFLERMRAARDDRIYVASIRGGCCCCCLLSRVRECVRMASAVSAALVYTASTPAAAATNIRRKKIISHPRRLRGASPCSRPPTHASPSEIFRTQERRGGCSSNEAFSRQEEEEERERRGEEVGGIGVYFTHR